MYVDDNDDRYPVAPGVAAVGGAMGTTQGSAILAGNTPEEERPLNQYVPGVQSFNCPADRGDTLRDLDKVLLVSGPVIESLGLMRSGSSASLVLSPVRANQREHL